MLERSAPADAIVTDAKPSLTRRRALFAVLVAVTIIGMLWLAQIALSAGGFGLIDIVLLTLFALTLPWTAIGFWNATIGFLVMRLCRNPVAAVVPVVAQLRGDEQVTASTAILVCIRNERPEHVIGNLRPTMAGLVAAGIADCFHIYVLSDSDTAEIVTVEEAEFAALAAEWNDRLSLTYRRRSQNRGFKAGNIRDFCEHWGGDHEFAVTLDADSIMPAAAILRLVRIMQRHPTIGILQGLVVGLPSTNAFSRLFQFGMRLGMRSYTIGSAWWQGDCGPYWGHNAVLRLRPFIAHCQLPLLPGRGPLAGSILSHDQIEAVLMRRAGYDVRVLPEEDLGWEQNPPTLIEFIRRDLRWCQGNMQYLRLLTMPGLEIVSRYQLVFAILMFLGSPAWIGLFVIGIITLAGTPSAPDFIRADAGTAVLVLLLVMWFAPKTATMIDVLLQRQLRAAFGGTTRLLAGVVAETVFTFLLLPIMWLDHTIFLGGLCCGRAIGWIGQVRDDHAVPLTLALKKLWLHSVLGVGAIVLLAATHPTAIPYALLMAAGLALSIPFAVISSSRFAGRWMVRIGLARLPEETKPPVSLRALSRASLEEAPSIPYST